MVLENEMYKTENLLKRSITLIAITTLALALILLVGIYNIYQIFYSSYFNQTEVTQIAFIGNNGVPTKMEILFSGFKSLKVITVCVIISILIIYCSGKFRRK